MEVEKALSGGASGQTTDSGVSTRLMGQLLTWLNDRKSDVYFIATANDISRMPPELTRAERFDGIFFIDLPNKAQRELIWNIYLDMFSSVYPAIRDDTSREKIVDEQWTGAEIKSCCRLAAMHRMSLEHASRNIVPVAKSSAEVILNMRTRAKDRYLSAEYSGIYDPDAAASFTPDGERTNTTAVRRRITRK